MAGRGRRLHGHTLHRVRGPSLRQQADGAAEAVVGRLDDSRLLGERNPRSWSDTVQAAPDQRSRVQCWNIIYVALIFAMRARNLGGPASDPEDDRAVLLKLLVATQIIYAWNMCLTKASVLLMYYRTFHLWTFSRVCLFLLGGFVLAWAVTTTFMSVFTCDPVQKLRYPEIPGRCLNHVAVWIASAIATVSSELAIVLFPIPLVCGLNLSLVEKMSVAFLFMMGFL